MATDANGNTVFGRYNVGLHNVGSYQSSGKPFITGSTLSAVNKVHMIEFPSVSKSFTVINTHGSNAIRVHFQSGSVASAITVPGIAGEQGIDSADDVISGKHFITIDASATLTMDTKCTKFYVSSPDATATYEVFAELTNIPADRMYHLTGSGITTAPHVP
tara:strand:+ start:40 stop:522 length:483 start_codon:yes stop_codon:yes gene_type:complete